MSNATGPTPPTRDRIRAAATELFERDGFAETGVREIAAAAGVTPALVIRYFGSKEGLFLEAVDMKAGGLSEALAGPLPTLGTDVVAYLLAHAGAGSPGAGVFAALMRASDRAAVRSSLQTSLERDVVATLVPRLDGPDADLRARLVSACVLGLLGALTLTQDEGLAAADPALVGEHYGRAIQALVEVGRS